MTKNNTTAPNSVLLKFWGFTGLASLLASVQFPAVDSDVFVNPQISEARFVRRNHKKLTVLLRMEYKTEQIKHLTGYLLKKYGEDNIVITDYWDGDNTAIGLADKTKQYTVYISDNDKTDQKFFVSLENPSTSDDFPYTPGENFDNLTIDEVEKIIVKHLKIA